MAVESRMLKNCPAGITGNGMRWEMGMERESTSIAGICRTEKGRTLKDVLARISFSFSRILRLFRDVQFKLNVRGYSIDPQTIFLSSVLNVLKALRRKMINLSIQFKFH